MKTLDIVKIIETHDLDVYELAKQLFPTVKYPKLALRRIFRGEAFLDTNQLSRLALMLGVPIEKLFTNHKWSVKPKKNILLFTSDDYAAELNTVTMTTNIFSKGSIFHEEMIHGGSITLGKYLDNLNQIINNYEQN